MKYYRLNYLKYDIENLYTSQSRIHDFYYNEVENRIEEWPLLFEYESEIRDTITLYGRIQIRYYYR